MTKVASTRRFPPASPQHPWSAECVRVRSVKHEIENVKTLQLEFTDDSAAAAYRFTPGQFNMLYLPGVGEAAISISSDAATPGILDHTIRVAGNVTTEICSLEAGDTLGLRGPFGRGWPMDECVGRDVLLVTGGIGLPPLRPVICSLLRERERFGQLHLLYGARSPDALVYRQQYDRWNDAGLQVQVTVDRSAPGWQGCVGVVTLLLERLEAFDPANTILMCCGPEIMMRFVARAAMQRGITHNRIWVSTERNMNCAIGLCGHCQLAGSFICKDGPVFRYDLIEPYLKIQAL